MHACMYVCMYVCTVLLQSLVRFCFFNTTFGRDRRDMPTHHSFLRARDELFAKIREFGHAAGSRARDAASKSRILMCPIFGCFVGGVPDRVFQNCKKVFSRPRPALQPLLICLHVRYRTQELRPSTTKVPFFAVRAKFGGLPGQISQNSFYIFLSPKHALTPPLICLLI